MYNLPSGLSNSQGQGIYYRLGQRSLDLRDRDNIARKYVSII